MSCGRWKFLGLLALAILLLRYAPRVDAGVTLPAGVIVDASGVVSMKVYRDPTGELTRADLAAARTSLSADLARPSELRKISLNRLEAALAERLARGEFESNEMKYLAGMTRVTHVFFYPDSKDIVIAGPAEGYYEDLSGRMIGMNTNHVVMELQDLIAALRAFPPSGERTKVIGVSIDPTKDGLQRMQQFLKEVGGRATPADTQRLAMGLKESLGQQVISIKGVSPKTHFAQVLVEADYRMKLIGIGLETPAANIVSYVTRVNPRSVSRNAMQRWYFTPNYDRLKVSEDGMAMELMGDGVKLVCENELVTGTGDRVGTKTVDRAAKDFAESFTKNYSDLAARTPVYAQMRNLIDLSIVAAFIQHQGYYSQCEWTMDTFGDEGKFPIESYVEPKFVDSAVNALWKGNTLMTPIGGGVNIQPRQAIADDRIKKDDTGALEATRVKTTLDHLADGQWWWD